MSAFEEQWKFARFEDEDEDVRRIASRAYEEPSLRELCPRGNHCTLRFSRRDGYPYDHMPFITPMKTAPGIYVLRGSHSRAIAKGKLDAIVPIAAKAMTWVTENDSPHEGYLIGFIQRPLEELRHEPGFSDGIWQRLRMSDESEIEGIKRIAVACDCGWCSPQISAPAGTRWTSCCVSLPDEAQETLARSLWIAHCESLRSVKIEDEGASLHALAEVTVRGGV